VTDSERTDQELAISDLPSEEKARRSASFGSVAAHYERYRPGPPAAAVDWILSAAGNSRVIDLGAGTGALTRLLLDRAHEVIAIEPDDRMRSVLVEEVPSARALAGRGESIPVPDNYADAVLASSSWHWMDLVPTLLEVARVLVPGGVLGVLWEGPDPEGPFIVQARAMLDGQSRSGSGSSGRKAGDPDHAEDGDDGDADDELATIMMGEADRPASILEIPSGVPFDQPEQKTFRWDVALNADELIGLLGTFSWIITLPDEKRGRVVAEARRLLRELLGLEGEATVDVAYRCDAWRSRRHA
jgi:SAM-dependent methyltransferase